MGRPKLKEDQIKSFMLRVRMTKMEKDALVRASQGAMSQYVRWLLFGKRGVNFKKTP